MSEEKYIDFLKKEFPDEFVRYFNSGEAKVIFTNLQGKNQKLQGLLERFCTKSNGLSMAFRCDWKYSKLEDIKNDLRAMYNFQCEVEKILNEKPSGTGKTI